MDARFTHEDDGLWDGTYEVYVYVMYASPANQRRDLG